MNTVARTYFSLTRSNRICISFPFSRYTIDVNELYGTIISEVGKLLGLQSLDLSGNNLVGTIPSSLGELTELTYLRLGT